MNHANTMRYNSMIIVFSLLMFMQASCVKQPEFKGIDDFQFIGQTDSTVTTEVTLLLENPNFFGLKINNVVNTIKLNGVQVASNNLSEETKLVKKSISSISFLSEIHIARLAEIYPDIMNADSSLLEVKGYVQVSKIKVNIDESRKLPLSDAIENAIKEHLKNATFEVSGIKMKEVSLKESKVEVDVAADNQLPFEMRIDSVVIDLYSTKDDLMGTVSSNEPTVVQPEESIELHLSATVDNFKSIGSLGGMIFKKDAKMRTKGTVYLNFMDFSFAVPIEKEVSLSNSKFKLPGQHNNEEELLPEGN